MKILVTGGGGFLGTAIIKELVKNYPYEIVNFSRNHYLHLDNLSVKTIKGDLRKKEDIENALAQNIDIVFHIAALAGVWGKSQDYEAINVTGTQNLLEAAQKNNVKAFIYTSTPSVVFNNEDILGGDENLSYSAKPLCDYQKTKIKAEEMVLKANSEDFKTCAIRPHLIFGPEDPHIFPRILEKARTLKLKKVGGGENLVDVTYVDNAAHAHVLAMEKILDSDSKVAGEAFFIGNEKPVNLWQFIDQILSLHHLPIVNETISGTNAYRVGFLMEKLYKFAGIIKPEPPMTRFTALNLSKSHYFNHQKAKERLGYEPLISVEEGLKRSIRPMLKKN